MAVALTKPSYLRECLLVRLKGSRESWVEGGVVRGELIGGGHRVSVPGHRRLACA